MRRRAARLASVPPAPAPVHRITGREPGDGPSPTAVPETGWEAQVDGVRIRIQARDEVVIQCGKASIVMRRNGRVVIQGCYVETRSAGTTRIRGGQVRVN